MGKKIDIRIIQLSKWHIPKQKSIFHTSDSAYFAIGHFDMISVKKVKSGEEHPLMSAYRQSARRSRNVDNFFQENYSTQELIVFTDIGSDGFTEKELDNFWEKDSLLLFVSLIHIDNESNMERVIEKIQNVFDETSYLYYFSLDYSGIVIAAKEMGLENFLTRMFRINYEESAEENMIRDSYSMYGFQKSHLKNYFESFDVNGYASTQIMSYEKFAVSVNIGMQGNKLYPEFIEKLETVSKDIKEYGLFGRHDISIVNECADLKWLLYVQYLLDIYTSAEKESSASENDFATHETFVKISMKDNLDKVLQPGKISGGEDKSGHQCSDGNQISGLISGYEEVKRNLDALCDAFYRKLMKDGEKKYNGEYWPPVQAVKYSVLGIMKNRFAEDFVICMYQSFCEFVRYLTIKMKEKDDNPEYFAECFRSYFNGLNCLVNSAMHSERQFIQATAFNAIIYDVPAKMMAFYTAIIYDIQKIMKGEGEKRYTFLLTPSFCNEINVRIISYKEEKLPHDRLLLAEINEKSLYNPGCVVRRMAHEIAHFSGDILRKRERRKEAVIKGTIYIILTHILHEDMQEEGFAELVCKVRSLLPQNRFFLQNSMNYSRDLLTVCPRIAEQFQYNKKIHLEIKKHICKSLKQRMGKKDGEGIHGYLSRIILSEKYDPESIQKEWKNLKQYSEVLLEILTNLIWEDIEKELGYVNAERKELIKEGKIDQSVIAQCGSRVLRNIYVGEFSDSLMRSYYEAFSDAQMIILLDFGYQEYLESFLLEEQIDLGQFPYRMSDRMRISMITMAFQYVGFWEKGLKVEKKDRIDQQKTELARFDRMVQEQIQIVINEVSIDNNEQERNKCYALVEYFRKMTGNESINVYRNEWIEQEDAGGDVMAYLNMDLFGYLLNCIKESFIFYAEEGRAEKIRHLREILGKVTKCDNIFKMFSAMCEEINTFKLELFGKSLTSTILHGVTDAE